LQTISVLPVFESILVFSGIQAQVTVLEFCCLVTTQFSISSADAGGITLFNGFTGATGAGGGGGGGGGAATGFFGEQPTRNRTDTSQKFFIAEQFSS
jgi:hypothetical protein